MRFAEPLAFLALILAPLALLSFRLLERRQRARMKRAGDLELLGEMSSLGPEAGHGARAWQAALMALALALVAVALARPQWGLKTEMRKARGMNLAVALDLSRSMLAKDVVPSRLERARIELGDLIDQQRGDRIGLIGFTSVAIPLCPLTVDHAALKLQLRSARPDDLPRGGTAIADAIRAGIKMLEASGKSQSAGGKAILILTDGEEHEGDPEAAAKEAKAAGIEVHMVGVGSRTGEPIPLVDEQGRSLGYLKDGSGQTVISRLNEKMLTSVAEAGGGIAALPGNNGGLDLMPIRNHLSELKREELDKLTVSVHEERYRWALVPAFLLLLISTLIRPRHRRATIPRMAVPGGLAMLLVWGSLLFATQPAEASPFEREQGAVKEGNQALNDGRAKDAVAAYERAKAELGSDPRLLFDRGLAEAASGELDAAVSDLKAAVAGSSDPAVRAQAALAMGNAYRSLKKYDEAIGAYRQALLEDPRNSGARKNLEIARAMKRIQALQPKDPNAPKQPGDDKKNDPPDGGTQDGGPPDSGGEPPDAGGGGDSGQSGGDSGGQQGGQDSGGHEGQDSGSPSGADSGQNGQDSGGAGEPPEQDKTQPDDPKQHQNAEQLLDALQQQEKALKHKRLLKQIRPKRVEKDW